MFQQHRLFFVVVPILLLKIYFVRTLLFDGTNLLSTIWLEIGYLLLIFSLIELLFTKKLKTIVYQSFNLLFSTILLAILIYHEYFGYIVTIDALKLIGQVGTVKDSVAQLVRPIYFILFLDFLFYIVFIFYRRKEDESTSNIRYKKFLITSLVIGLILTGTNIFSQRGVEIANSVVAAEKQGIFTYEVLSFKNTVFADSNKLSPSEIATLSDTIREVKNIEVLPEDERRLLGIAEGKNIIAIQVEALQEFVINLSIDGKEVTPFLNSLLDESLYFSKIYQQIGPGNTSDAEFLFNTSLYPRGNDAASEKHGHQEIPSLPKLLKDKDYTSITLHANDVSFWNRNNLYSALGFDKYYDTEFYGNDDVIGIGPSDEVLFQKAIPTLKEFHDQGDKFYAHFVSLSSHHPFKIPEHKEVMTLPEEFQGSIVGDYLQSLNYTDKAIEQFVNSLKEEGIWDDVVLVMYGDHFGLSKANLSTEDLNLVDSLVGHPYTYMDQYNIPVLFTVAGENISEVNDTVGGQIDIMPTLANMINLSLDEHIHFGQDLVNYTDNLIGIRYYLSNGSFFNNDISFMPVEGFKDGIAFDIYTFEPISDFSQYEEDYNRVKQLLNLSDSYLDSLPAR